MRLKHLAARTACAAAALAIALAAVAAQAQTKVSNLPAAAAVSSKDVFPASQGCTAAPPTAGCTTTAGVTAAQLQTWAQAGLASVNGAIASNGSGSYSQASAANLTNGTTGSGGAIVLATSPTLATPTLGVATVTTVKGKNAITSITAGAVSQIGTGGTVVCATSHVCDSLSGELTIATGTGTLTEGTLFTANFADTRTNIANCVISHFDIGTGGTSINSYSHSATTSTLAVQGTLSASTTYTFDYICGGN